MRLIRRFLIARALRRLLVAGTRQAIKSCIPELAGGHIRSPEHFRLWQAASSLYDLSNVRTAPPPTVRVEAGRQSIRMPHTFFGGPGWPGLIPRQAHEAPWEDCHTFPKGGRPHRDSVGLHGDPPLAFVCPACDLAQPPMSEDTRDCGYCGIHVRRVGTRLYWWRPNPIEVPEWKP